MRFNCVVLTLILTITHTATGQGQCGPLLETQAIVDAKITASSSYSIYTPDQARLDTGYGWLPALNRVNQYLHIDLLDQFNVTKYHIKGGLHSASWFVRTFTLYYSQNGFSWNKYVTSDGTFVLEGNNNNNNVNSQDLDPPVKARYLAFQPVSGKGLRLDLTGCKLNQPEASSYTLVSEDIDDAQDWAISKSPYVINSTIRIETSGQVKVQPGVKVIFNSTDAGLIVLGNLEAVGQRALPIEFGYPRPFSREISQWKSLEVTAEGNLTLGECGIYGAVSGVKGPLSSITLTNCHIHENVMGVELTAGDSDMDRTQLSGVRVAKNSNQGISIHDWSNQDKFISMRDCHILENGDSGLSFVATISLSADNCTFSANRVHGMANDGDGVYDIKMDLTKCRFTGNGQNGFQLELPSSSNKSMDIVITDSEILVNQKDGLYMNLNNPPRGMRIVMERSQIVENSGDGIRIGARCDKEAAVIKLVNNTLVGVATHDTFAALVNIGSESSDGTVNITMINNIFEKGRAIWMNSYRGTNCEVSNNTITTTAVKSGDVGIRISGKDSDISFSDNRFVNCTTETVIAALIPVKFHKNVFLNPDAETDITIGYRYTDAEPLDARYNYWGSIDKFQIGSRICDFFCDMGMALAEIDPFYTTENLTELSTELDSHLFSFQTADTIGGILNESLTMGPHQYLFVNRSMYVPEGYQLTILENVTLVFSYMQGILVEGTIDIQGEERNKVSLISRRTDSINWRGLRISKTGSSIKHAEFRKVTYFVELTNSSSAIVLNITDTLITNSNDAVRGRLSSDLQLLLHNVNINDSFAGLYLSLSKNVTASVDVRQSRIESQHGIRLSSLHPGGHFNINLKDTKVLVSYSGFDAEGCKNKFTLTVKNCTFTSSYLSAINIAGSLLDVQCSQMSVKAPMTPVKIIVCGAGDPSDVSGRVDIQNSSFIAQAEDSYALDIGPGGEDFPPLYMPEENVGVCNLPHFIKLKDNTFSTVQEKVSVYIKTSENCSCWNVQINRNNFELSGLEIDGSVCNITVDDNFFHQSFQPLSVNLLGNETSLLTISRNKVEGSYVILHSEKYSDSFNLFANEFFGSSVYLTTSQAQFLENIMYGGSIVFVSERDVNVHDIQLNTFNGSQVFLKNPNVIVRKNRFYRGPPLSLFFGSNCYEDRSVNCSHNYWGTADKDEIAGRIFDSNNDPNLATVNFIPFYGSPDWTNLQYPVYSFLSPDGTIGGRVEGRVTLQARETPYTVTASIVVGKMDTLVLKAGVSLKFPKGTGITVEGILRILGNSTHFVFAKSLDYPDKWAGVKLLKPKHLPAPFPLPNIRVADGCEGKEGRLEVRLNGTWGTVCGEGFDQEEAKVVCRMLGYDPSTSHLIMTSGEFDEGSGPILMGNLDCDGTETSLEDCPASPPFNCSHHQDVAIRCNGKRLPTPQEVANEVELRHFSMAGTENGLELDGNVIAMVDVNSTESNTHGITIKQGLTGLTTIDGIYAAGNRYSGLAFESSSYNGPNWYLNLSILNCDLYYNGEYGIHILYGVNLSLINCSFIENEESAIYLKGESIIDISNSTFIRNERGVFNMNELKRFNGFIRFSLRRSLITDNVKAKDAHVYDIFKFFPVYTEACIYEFDSNVFEDNLGNVLFLNTHRSSVKNIIRIHNNTFKNNSAGLVYVQSPVRNTLHFYFSNNTVINNTFSASEVKPLIKVDLRFSQEEIRSSHVSLSRNVISRNTVPEVVHVEDLTSFSSNISVMENIFKDNNSTNTLVLGASAAVVKSNIFTNPLVECELASPVFISLHEVDARWNYWGGLGVQFVFSRVCGFDSDMSRGFVHYLPYHLSQLLTDTSDFLHTDFWINNLHGGVVDTQLRLTKVESPHIIARSIYIRKSGVLSIESGVVMRFQSNTGIYVDGVLLAGGSDTSRVTLTRADPSLWHGVVLPYHTGTSGMVRLVDGLTPAEGLVEICYKGSWTTVCSMDHSDAQLICQALGYSPAGVTTRPQESFREERGSIVANLGCEDSVWSLTQCRPLPRVNASVCNHGNDIGIACRKSVALTGTHKMSYLEGVSIFDSKEGLLIQTPTVRLSNCHINNTESAGLTVATDAIDLDLNGTVVEYGQSDGIVVTANKYVRIHNGTTQFNQRRGLVVSGNVKRVAIEAMNFVNNSLYHYISSREIGERRLQINRNTFHGTDSGIDISMNYEGYDYEEAIDMNPDRGHDIDVVVEENQFVNITGSSLQVSMKESKESKGTKRLQVKRNDFMSTGPMSITTQVSSSVFVEDNTVQKAFAGDKCFLDLDVKKPGSNQNDKISISANKFKTISGRCVVSLKSINYRFKGTMDFNSIVNSSLNDAVVVVDSKFFTFAYNIFNNSQSDYEMKVRLAGDDEIKAENNWWGGVNLTTIGKRIMDKQRNRNLLSVDIIPILLGQEFDCVDVENCSDNGRCVSPNGCWCDPGWAGNNCSEFECSGVNDCSVNGECVGPDQCNCTSGWTGRFCHLFVNADFGEQCKDEIISTLPTTSTTSTTTTNSTSTSTATSKTTVSAPGVSGCNALQLLNVYLQYFIVICTLIATL